MIRSHCRRWLFALSTFAAGCDVPEQPPAAAAVEVGPRWRVGDAHRYAVDWQVDTDLTLAGLVPEGGGQVRMRLVGEVRLRVHPDPRGGVLLGLAWQRLDVAVLDVLGGAAWSDRDAAARQLVGPEVLCELGEHGEIAAAYFDPTTPAPFRHLMSGLLVHTDLRLPAPGESELATAGSAGLLRARYRRDPAEPALLRRDLVEFAELRAVPSDILADARVEADGAAVVQLGGRDVPESIEAHEGVRVVAEGDAGERYASRATFSMKRLASERFAPAEPLPLDVMVRQIPGEVVDDPGAARELAAKFAGDLTVDAMLAEIAAARADIPARRHFIVETSGLLRAEPALAEQLVPLLIDPASDAIVRARAADVLSAAGTPEAQSALLRALDSGVVRADADRFPRLFERLGFVRAPEPETVAYVLREHRAGADEPDATLHRTTLYTLGAVGRHVAAREPSLAAAVHAEIVARLDGARTHGERTAALAGLGNFASDADAPRILAFVATEDADLRAHAAVALSHLRAPEARAALVRMVADPAPDVALQALAGVEDDGPALAEAAALVAQVEARATSPQICAALINTFVRWSSERADDLGELATRGLLALADSAPDPALRAKAQALAEH